MSALAESLALPEPRRCSWCIDVARYVTGPRLSVPLCAAHAGKIAAELVVVPIEAVG
jgi:hypothetical protein